MEELDEFQQFIYNQIKQNTPGGVISSAVKRKSFWRILCDRNCISAGSEDVEAVRKAFQKEYFYSQQ